MSSNDENVKVTMDNRTSLFGLIFYFGIGALFHALLLGSEINWSSMWTYGVVLGWPMILVGIVAIIALAVFVLAIGFIGVMHVWESISNYSRMRKFRGGRIGRRS